MALRLLIVLAMLCLPALCVADTGEVFLSFNCDKTHKMLSVEPRLVWNEELEKVDRLMKQKGRAGVVMYDGGLLIDVDHLNKVHVCKIGGHVLSVSVSVPDPWNPALEITTDARYTASIGLGNVVKFYGPVFRLRFTPEKRWEEFCGRENDAVVWSALKPERTTTDCQ